MKSLIVFVIAVLASTGMTIGSSFAAAPSPQKQGSRLAQQDKDTPENIEDYGYRFDSRSNKHVFTFDHSTVNHILHHDFDLKKPADGIFTNNSGRKKTRQIKKLLLDIVTNTIDKFPGSDFQSKTLEFTAAVHKRAMMVYADGVLDIDKIDVTKISEVLYESLQENLTQSIARTAVQPSAERAAGMATSPQPVIPATPRTRLEFNPENLIHHFIERFKDGLKEYSGEDKDYSDIKEITEADLNNAHERPDFKTFLRYLKSLGIVPLNPEAFRTLFLPAAAAAHETEEEETLEEGIFDD